MKREGRHLSVKASGDEVYRVTRQQDGRWLWCDHYSNHGGDNIDLVREIQPGMKYSEAVYQLYGSPSVQPQQRPTEPQRHPPRVPVQSPVDRDQGRDYLKGRGISAQTIQHAEKTGMVQYTDGAVLFVGRDQDGKVQNVNRRATKADDPVQKRDFRGSDKSYPPILPGDPATVWIVEGGPDALALHDIAKRSGQQQPTVIVSGGANVRSFLEREQVQEMLKRADRVTVCGENERTLDAQARADQGHQRQADRVAEITGREVRQWTPPEQGGKDLADYNRAHAQKYEWEKKRQQVQERQQEHSRGPSLGR